MTPQREAEYRRRQRSRAKATAIALGLMVVLFFAIAIARLSWDETDQALMRPERKLFKFSIVYLFALFGMLVVDRILLA